jgi:ferredoxin
VKVYVDQSACTAGGLCEEAVPEVFVLEGSGLATVIQASAPLPDGGIEAGGAEVPVELESRVRDAAAACPGACILCTES